VAVAVVVDDRVAFSEGYGVAGDGERMTPASPVVIGSTSKSITATAILQLVEAGRVELDAPVRRYLPWFDPADERGQDITVRQLLVDTSGVPTWAGWSALGGDGRADDAGIRRLINHVRLTSAPGTRFQYSNANYIALGQVIEAVTGQRYADYVRRAIFEPLGMQHTVAGELAGGSTPNRYWFGTPVPSHLPYLEIGIPAGAISASAEDLAHYLQAQLHHGSTPDGAAILTASSVDVMQAPAVVAEGFGVPSGRHYAMGWYVGTVAGEHAVFHSGDVFDSSSSLVMLPEQQVGVVVVATTSSAITPVANTLAEGVTDVMMGKPAKELGGALALGTVGLMTVAGIVLAFAVVRVRRLITEPPARRAAFARLAILDVVVPVAIVVGLPLAFSHNLHRAETVDPITFWRLVTRGVPDAGYVVLLALLLRFAIGVATGQMLARRALSSESP
jgi:CubicO group peptidase (beta-lactamase class C family)